MSVGQLYFAWVSNTETFDPAVHAREDEDVFALKIIENEGEYSTASVEVRNPRVGLLSPARKQRCFISADLNGSVQILFSGRVVGIPLSIADDTMELEFIGRPDDHAAVQAAFVETMKTDPRYHDALVAEESRTDPTAVLEGFAGLLHWHRATGALSLAPIANDGIAQVTDVNNDFFHDSLAVTFASAPINSVSVTLDISWTQTVPLVSRPFEADPGFGARGAFAQAFGGRPETLTGDDFMNRWPAPGSSLDGGWSVLGAYLRGEVSGKYTRNVPVSVAPPADTSWLDPTYPIDFFKQEFDGNLVLSATYEQPRRESVSFTVTSDLQPVVEFPAPETLSLSVDGADIVDESPFTLSVSYRAPQEDSDALSTRIQTTTLRKGDLTLPRLAAVPSISGSVLAAAVARAEARLRKAARCVSVAFDCDFGTGAGLTTASVVRIADSRLPGGYAVGKVTSVELVLSGDGACYSKVELGCSVGRAAAAVGVSVTVTAYDAPHEPSVVTTCRTGAVDDGTHSVSSMRVRNGVSVQQSALDAVDLAIETNRFLGYGYLWARSLDDEAAKNVLELTLVDIPTEIDAQLVSVEASEETVTPVFAVASDMLAVTRDIDLEGV